MVVELLAAVVCGSAVGYVAGTAVKDIHSKVKSAVSAVKSEVKSVTVSVTPDSSSVSSNKA